MGHWLLKTEPGSYGWNDLVRDGGTEWDGVRNHAAARHLRAMALGDEALIYHSGGEKAALGIARVTRGARPDGDGRVVRHRAVMSGSLQPGPAFTPRAAKKVI